MRDILQSRYPRSNVAHKQLPRTSLRLSVSCMLSFHKFDAFFWCFKGGIRASWNWKRRRNFHTVLQNSEHFISFIKGRTLSKFVSFWLISTAAIDWCAEVGAALQRTRAPHLRESWTHLLWDTLSLAKRYVLMRINNNVYSYDVIKFDWFMHWQCAFWLAGMMYDYPERV